MRFSQKARQCEQSPMRKFHPYAVAAQAQGKKIYHLNIGQPDIETPKAYFEALASFHEPVVRYAPSPGIPSLLQAVENYYENLGLRYKQEDILITTGGSEALLITMLCLLDPGDEVIVAEPYYPNYAAFIGAAGGVIRPITTSVEEGYFYAQKERIEPLINEKTRAILITNPGNPTGTILSHPQMRMLADLAKEHGLFLIADEVYREFDYRDGEVNSFGEMDDAAENVILIDSVSKRFSACGTRIGCLISRNKEFMGHALKYCQSRLAVATIDQVAAAALYSVPADYFRQVREEYRRRRDTVVRKLQKIPGVTCACPEGAFYLMARLPVDNAEKFQLWLLESFSDHNETVMFAPGGSFYATPGKGTDEIRIAYILKQEDLERAMDLLQLGLEQYPGRI